MFQKANITIEKHNGVFVLRDDLLQGGTKSILMDDLLDPTKDEYIYASPVYGAFQIALSIYCINHFKTATIFCAKRNELHPNTIICKENGANIIEVPYGYLSNIESKAHEYLKLRPNAQKLMFGARNEQAKDLIAERMREIIRVLGVVPDSIWCAIGSGTLVEGILRGTTTSKVNGVSVGAAYENFDDRLTIYKYPKKFEWINKYPCPFKSMPNYDLKAWESCMINKRPDEVTLFWNVY